MAPTAQEDAEKVTKLLLDSDLPTATCQMLINGLPHAISTQGGVRHTLQEQFIAIVRTTVLQVQQAVLARQEDVRGAIEAAKQHSEEGRIAEATATQAEGAASALVQERAAELSARREAVARTKREHAEAELVKDHFASASSELEVQKSKVCFILDGPLHMLRDGGWEDQDARGSAIDAVETLLRSMKADPALVAAVPKALACRLEDRTAFDALTIASVAEVLHEKKASLEQQLQAGKAERDDATFEALGLQVLSEREHQEEMVALAALLEAKSSLQDAIEARKHVADELARRGQELSLHLSSQVLEDEKSKHLGAALEAVERLVAFEYNAEIVDASCAATAVMETAASGNPLGVSTPMAA